MVDDFRTGFSSNLSAHPHLTIVEKDIRKCQPADFTVAPDGVVHLAAHGNNLSASLAVIEICRALFIPRLVFARSAAVYGRQIQIPIAESSTVNPISPYGLQKLCSERYLSLFAPEFAFTTVSLRLFNVFGPGQSPNSPYSGVISLFSDAIRRGNPITVYGNGEQTRDFVQALTCPLTRGASRIYNIGSGARISWLQLIDKLRQLVPESNTQVNFDSSRLGDIPHSGLGFLPQWTFEEGLKALVNGL